MLAPICEAVSDSSVAVIGNRRIAVRSRGAIAQQNLAFFAPRTRNGSGFPVGAGQVSAKLENLIFNHHTRLRFGGSQDHAKQKIFRIEIALEAC
jgi:hypothetical protein